MPVEQLAEQRLGLGRAAGLVEKGGQVASQVDRKCPVRALPLAVALECPAEERLGCCRAAALQGMGQPVDAG